MAVADHILIPTGASPTKASPAASASTAEILLGGTTIFSIVCTGNCHVKFGTTGMAAAAVTDHFIAANTKEVYNLSRNFTAIRVFNPTGAGIDVYVSTFALS
jgi:hypothetical protein